MAIEVIGKELPYRQLANFCEDAQRLADISAQNLAEEERISIEEITYNCDFEALQILKKYFEKVPKDASSRYCEGIYSFLKELWQRLNRQTP